MSRGNVFLNPKSWKFILENNVTKSGRSLSFQCCFCLVHLKILEIWFRKKPFQKSAFSLSKAASHFALSCVLNSPHTPVEMLQHYQLATNEERPFESATTRATKQTRREDTKFHTRDFQHVY